MEDWPDTDFYGSYWAHDMSGTLISHIVSWGWLVMKRGWTARGESIDQLPPRLSRLVYSVPAIAIIIVILVVGILAYPVYATSVAHARRSRSWTPAGRRW